MRALLLVAAFGWLQAVDALTFFLAHDLPSTKCPNLAHIPVHGFAGGPSGPPVGVSGRMLPFGCQGGVAGREGRKGVWVGSNRGWAKMTGGPKFWPTPCMGSGSLREGSIRRADRCGRSRWVGHRPAVATSHRASVADLACGCHPSATRAFDTSRAAPHQPHQWISTGPRASARAPTRQRVPKKKLKVGQRYCPSEVDPVRCRDEASTVRT